MAEELLQSQLLAACSSLGYSDGLKYYKEPDCLVTLKDLIKYLRRDDDCHSIRRALGKTRVIQTDLVPIIRSFGKDGDSELFDVTIRLLVNLTNPVLLLFKEELPEEKLMRQYFLELLSQQQEFKEPFAEEVVWSVIVQKLGLLLQKDVEDREEEENLIIERILILVRNVLAVPASPAEELRTDDDASVHDQVLWALHLAGFEDLLLYIASSENEHALCMHTLEIISLMLREQDPAQLAKVGSNRAQSEKEKDAQELLECRKKEAMQKLQSKNMYSARHSRFGGSYCVLNMKSISERDIIIHQPITSFNALNFDKTKRHKKTPKNRQPMKFTDKTRRSTLAIRIFLQEFCVEFLNGAYNSIMFSVKDCLNNARAQEHDESYYLWSLRFFMEFNRCHKFRVELISETLSLEIFHYIHTNLENYYGMMTTDKKKFLLWSRRMHNALRAYKEIFMSLVFMERSDNEGIKASSKILKHKIIYSVDYRELILVLLQTYNEVKLSHEYLKDLIETAYVFLKIMDNLCNKHKHLLVQKKLKIHKKGKKSKEKKNSCVMTEEKLQDMWDEYASEISSLLEGSVELPETVPFDAVSEVSDEIQKEDAVKKINAHLRQGELAVAVSLYRSSREVWPDNIFGAKDITAVEEFSTLRDIFMANVYSSVVADNNNDMISDDDDEKEEREEDFYNEQQFEFVEFVRRFAHTKVMQAYSKLFKLYKSNAKYTNHCILKMFYRIAWDVKLPAIFFQASIFKTLQNIFIDYEHSRSDDIKELAKFAKFIVRNFFEVLEVNKKVLVELLFWKTNKEAMEIECGYSLPSEISKKLQKAIWTEAEEHELTTLYEEFKDKTVDSFNDKDVVDLILEAMINKDRTRRSVIKKLKELKLINNLKDISKKSVKVKAPKEWIEDEVLELKILFEEYKDSMNPVVRIIENMCIQKPRKRVVDKIMELGLVSDKKELRNKIVKKSTVRKKNIGESFLEANANNYSNNESDDKSSESSDESDGGDGEDNIASSKSLNNFTKSEVVTPSLVISALRNVENEGLKEAVEWIAGFLNEVADDREEDGDFEPIPILPVTDIYCNAMENKKFIELLKVIGIKPPQSHQEMFWRVPSNMSVNSLRNRAQYLFRGWDISTELESVSSNSLLRHNSSDLQNESLVRKSPVFENNVISSENNSFIDNRNCNEFDYKGKGDVLEGSNIISNKRPKFFDDNDENNELLKKRRIYIDDSDEESSKDVTCASSEENLHLSNLVLNEKRESSNIDSNFNGSLSIIDSEDEDNCNSADFSFSKKKRGLTIIDSDEDV